MQIQYNRTARTEKPKYIVVHCTGNTRSGADAAAHFQYWNGGNVGQSADFVVDDKEALQINDYNKYYTWHCGDGKGRYGITNANSIGVEICVNADGDFEKALDNAVVLLRKLKAETGIENVVRHYDASRKICPAALAENDWEKWKELKRRIAEVEELTSVNDIVWELADRNIISDVALWLQELENDENVYWLARRIGDEGFSDIWFKAAEGFIGLYPAPRRGENVTVWYFQRPMPLMTEDEAEIAGISYAEQEIRLDPDYMEMLKTALCITIAEAREDVALANNYKMNYNMLLARARQERYEKDGKYPTTKVVR